MKFFADKAGNRWVAVLLQHEPIPESVEFWEGGYKAPPHILRFFGKAVAYGNTDCSTFEEYVKDGTWYQVKYCPRR